MNCSLLLCIHLLSANPTTPLPKNIAHNREYADTTPVSIDTGEVYTFVEQQPTFPGGENGINKYLAANVKYPKEAQAQHIEGTCFVQFIVDKNGIVKNARIISKKTHPYLDEEALRVVNAMPAWKPGIQDGKQVSVFFNLPVRFQLQRNPNEQPAPPAMKTKYEQGEPPAVAKPGAGEPPAMLMPEKIKDALTKTGPAGETSALYVPGKDSCYTESTDTMFTADNHPPIFSGGQTIHQFIVANRHYPKMAWAQNISGTVIVQFMIDTAGHVKDPIVTSRPLNYLDDEALRVVRLLPDWSPAVHNGKPISTFYVLQLPFLLKERDKPNIEKPTVTINGILAEKPDTISLPGDHPANFDDGKSVLLEFLYDHIKYPNKAVREKISGTVVASFIVNKSGAVTDVTIISKHLAYLDTEVLRAVSSIPDWEPAVKQGKPTSTQFNLPINFDLP